MDVSLKVGESLSPKLHLGSNQNDKLHLGIEKANKVELKLIHGEAKQDKHLDISEKYVTVVSGVDDYKGPYTVIPDTESQKLETKDKRMTDDVNVKEIPTYEVSNNTGTTFYIGKEVI